MNPGPSNRPGSPTGNLAAAENYIVSYPKTGRTWLRILIGRSLDESYDLPHEKQAFQTEHMVQNTGLPLTIFTHGDAGIRSAKNYNALNADKSFFRDKRVVLLGRDLRDTMVSAYFHTSRRMGLFGGTLPEFIRDEYHGAAKFLTFYRHWYENQQTPRGFLFLRYEELHADPAEALARTIAFLGVRVMDPRAVSRAIEFASFATLQKNEAAGTYRNRMPGNRADPESYKFRRGKVAGYVDYLSPEDIAYLDQMNDQLGCEFTRRHEH